MSGAAFEFEVDGVFGKPGSAPFAGDLAAGDGADDAVDVDDGELGFDFFAAFDGGFAERQEDAHVERLFEAVVLGLAAVGADVVADVGFVEDGGEVDADGFPVFGGFAGVEAIDAADHFIDGAESEFGHDFAHFHGEERHEIDDVLGFASEVFAEFRVLGGDADRAGVFLADAHEDAAHGDERGGGEAELLGA